MTSAQPAATVSQAGTVATNHKAVLAVTSLALATVVSAVASLNVAIPSIARDTHATQSQLSWVIDAYALVFAALLLLGGAIGDRYGRRRALLVGLGIFGAGSLAATFASHAGTLIAMRAVLGVGAALVMPATLSTITSTFPAKEKAKAVGVWAGVAGGSAILGLLASGVVLEWWEWRSVFWLNVVLAVVASVATARIVPESADPKAPRLDVLGALITVAGLGCLVYSIIQAPEQGWSSARTVGGLVGGLVILAVFVGWELRQQHPLLDPRLFKVPAFAAGTLSIMLQFFAFFGFIFLVLQYLQLVMGHRPLISALCLVPMAAGLMPASRIAPRIAARGGSRQVCAAGLVLVAGGMVVLAQLNATSSYWLMLAGVLPLGIGMGLGMTPATAAITDALPVAQQGVGSAMNDLARELGGALGIAVLGSILESTYRAHVHPTGVPAPMAALARSSLALAEHLGGPTAAQARTAFTDGMHNALLFAAGVAVVAAVAVLGMLRSSRR